MYSTFILSVIAFLMVSCAKESGSQYSPNYEVLSSSVKSEDIEVLADVDYFEHKNITVIEAHIYTDTATHVRLDGASSISVNGQKLLVTQGQFGIYYSYTFEGYIKDISIKYVNNDSQLYEFKGTVMPPTTVREYDKIFSRKSTAYNLVVDKTTSTGEHFFARIISGNSQSRSSPFLAKGNNINFDPDTLSELEIGIGSLTIYRSMSTSSGSLNPSKWYRQLSVTTKSAPIEIQITD